MTRGNIGLPGKGNIFKKCPGIAIHSTGPTVGVNIFDNLINAYDDTKGKDITISNASATGGTINGNIANEGYDAASNLSFLDKGSNNWLLNYKNGITASMPAHS